MSDEHTRENEGAVTAASYLRRFAALRAWVRVVVPAVICNTHSYRSSAAVS